MTVSIRKQLRAMAKELKGCPAFVLFEGEQVIPSVAASVVNGLQVFLNRRWRPEGQAMPPGIEPIPGYVRPQNWERLQEAEDHAPGAIGIDNQIWRV